MSASLEKETLLFAKDRNFAKTGNIPPFVVAAATGQGNIQGGYNPNPNPGQPYDPALELQTGNAPGPIPNTFGAGGSSVFGSPATGFGNPVAAAGQCAAINMYDAGLTSLGAPYCQFDSNAFVGLIPKRDLATLSANLTFKLTDNLEAFGDALYSKSKVKQEFQPSPLRRDFLQTDLLLAPAGVEPALIIRPTNPNYQIAADYLNAQGFGALVGQPLAVTARVFDFGPRSTVDTAKQTRLTGGLRGNFAKQDWEVAVHQNESKLAGSVVSGHFSQLAFARVVNDAASDYNPWSLTQSQAFNNALAAAGAEYVGPTIDSKLKSMSADAKLSGDILQLPAGPLQYAAGVQSRKEEIVLTPSPAQLSGDIAGIGGAVPPLDRDRTVKALYGELNAPLLKGLEANLAIRNDDYDDVGKSTNYKASLRWQPVSQVLLRGSVGTGFRAPTLVDLWNPVVLGASEQFNDPVTGQTDLQVNSFTGGFSGLKPEESRQRTIGIVLAPIRELTVSLDYFQIRVEDIIAQESAQAVVSRNAQGDPSYASLVTRGPGGDIESITQLLRNVGTAKVKGVDVEAAWRLALGPGRLDLNLAGTYMIKFDQTSPSGVLSRKVGTMVEPDGTPVLSTNSDVVGDGVVLRWKHYLAATWSQGPWAFTFAQNFYKGYRDGNDLNGDPHRITDQAIYDAQVAFYGIKNLKLALGVKNMFDRDPPIFIPSGNQFQGGYDPTQYDPRARFVYVSASYKF